jgi:glycosyltransferase involved in cell wall biosynthesis
MPAAIALSVIIPTRNRPAQLRRVTTALLDEMRAHQLRDRVEIVLADDASDDPAARFVGSDLAAGAPGTVQIVELPRQGGPSAARNAGVARSRGDVLAFLDDDVVPADDYLRQTLAFHASRPDVLVANGNLRPLRDDAYSRFWFHLYDATFNRPGEVYPVAMLASGHFAIKRELLALLGEPLFDVALRRREDFDLYLRLRARDVTVHKCDRIVAFNDCRRSLLELVRQYAGYEVSEQQIVAKHGAAAMAARLPVKREWRFLHLYVLLRAARETALVGARLRRLARAAAPRRRPA